AGIADARSDATGGIIGAVKAAAAAVAAGAGAGARIGFALPCAVIALAGGPIGVKIALVLLSREVVGEGDRAKRQPDERQHDDLRALFRVHPGQPAMQAAVRMPSESETAAWKMPSAMLPSVMACGRCGSTRRDTRCPISDSWRQP